jgi:hypothetical protein
MTTGIMPDGHRGTGILQSARPKLAFVPRRIAPRIELFDDQRAHHLGVEVEDRRYDRRQARKRGPRAARGVFAETG